MNYFTAEEGALYPVYLQFFQPSEDYELSVDSFIRVINPPVVPLLSGQRVFFHYYAVTFPQLWKQFQSFLTKGRNGSVSFRVPEFELNISNSGIKQLLGRGTLFDFLVGSLPKSILEQTDGNSTIRVNALPFMAYQRIYRDYYMNQRLNSQQVFDDNNPNSEYWFPYDDADFRLDTSGLSPITNRGSNSKWSVQLQLLRFRNYADDYFTSALETPMLGETPTVDFNFSSFSSQVGVELDNTFKALNVSGFMSNSGAISTLRQSGALSIDGGTGSSVYVGSLNSGFSNTPTYNDSKFNSPLITSPTGTVQSDFNANQIRDLLVLSHIAEKHARIDGSYSEYIQTFFDRRPRSGQDFRPTYIGGSYQRIQFGEVLQTFENSDSPLGTIGGKGASSNSGYIGRYHSEDYGFIMGIMSIVPDTIYSTGVNRSLLYSVQEDFPLPERNDLGMQPIYKKELLWTGDSEVDYDVWAYQDRYDELRYHSNEIHGLFGDSDSLTFSPYTQYRKIENMPTLSQSFVTLGNNNINKDWRSVVNLPPYGCQVYTKSLAVKPMPYKAIPVGLL